MDLISCGAKFDHGANGRSVCLLKPVQPANFLLILLVAGSLCTGCIPLKFTTSPGATGTVVDATTHAPITGAEVLISRSTYPPSSPDAAFTNSRPPLVMSQTNGQFAVPSQRRLDFYVLPVDVFPRFGLLVIKTPGYETTCVPFWSKKIADLGEIKLTAAHK
jgi:hypothetical protein